MINCIIVEDIPGHIQYLKDSLKKTKHQVRVLKTTAKVKDAYAYIDTLTPELIFLDIQMEHLQSGFDLLKMFDEIEFSVVFTSVHDEPETLVYAMRACRACDMDFLIKPYTVEELDAALDRYVNNKESSRSKLRALMTNLANGAKELKTIFLSLIQKVELPYVWIILCTAILIATTRILSLKSR